MSDPVGLANGIDLNSASEEELEQVGVLDRDRAHRLVEARPLANWGDVERIAGFGRELRENLQRAGARIGGYSGLADRSEHDGRQK
jgi:DNA uptake protein ComE-like DNA-binding protein